MRISRVRKSAAVHSSPVDLMEAIHCLAPKERAVVLEMYWNNSEPDECADALGMSKRAVSRAIRSAEKALALLRFSSGGSFTYSPCGNPDMSLWAHPDQPQVESDYRDDYWREMRVVTMSATVQCGGVA